MLTITRSDEKFELFFEDMITISRIANGVRNGMDEAEVDATIAGYWNGEQIVTAWFNDDGSQARDHIDGKIPMPRRRTCSPDMISHIHSIIKLMVMTIASNVK